MRRKKLTHFSHQHPLREVNVKEEDGTTCSCCELDLSGSAFKCNVNECDFFMHVSCLELPEQIKHKSHVAHSLTLRSQANDYNQFFCNACGENGSAFTYQCSICDYDLHVKCSSLPETVKREDHEHPISLNYSISNNKDDTTEIVCDVCDENVKDGCWVYCCVDCDFGTHLDCATLASQAEDEESEEEEDDKEEGEEENKEESSEVAGAMATASANANALMMAQIKHQNQMNLIQFQMNANHRQAQFMNSLTNSMRNI